MNAGLDRERLLELIPHAGRMCLLDRVVTHSEDGIECTTRTHEDPDHPLRREGRISALHLVEYAAQAMAAHGALRSFGEVQRGMLAALRGITLHIDRLDTLGELTITATRRLEQTTGSLYDFSVRHGGQVLCEGRIAIAFL